MQGLPEKYQGVRHYAWLELCFECNEECEMCYVGAGPGMGFGNMVLADWLRVLDELKQLGCGTVQLIGGEPTCHPNFCEILTYAADLGIAVEVYSNLLEISDEMWRCFEKYKVSLDTSFFSDTPAIHDNITKTQGSYEKILSNIKKAIGLGLKISVGMIERSEDQRIIEGRDLLLSLGVEKVTVDRTRGVGRGTATLREDPYDSLCGACHKSKAMINCNGQVFPCLFARSGRFALGNVHRQSLAEIINGPRTLGVRTTMMVTFGGRSDKGHTSGRVSSNKH